MVSGGMWKVVEISAGKIRMGDAEGRKSEGGSREKERRRRRVRNRNREFQWK